MSVDTNTGKLEAPTPPVGDERELLVERLRRRLTGLIEPYGGGYLLVKPLRIPTTRQNANGCAGCHFYPTTNKVGAGACAWRDACMGHTRDDRQSVTFKWVGSLRESASWLMEEDSPDTGTGGDEEEIGTETETETTGGNTGTAKEGGTEDDG